MLKIASGKNIPSQFPVNKFIVPFAFEYNDYNDCVKELLNRAFWKSTNMISSDNEFYKYISDLIVAPDLVQTNEMKEANIGVSFQYVGSTYKQLYLNKQELIHINDIQLVMFKNNVGFLIIDVGYQNKKDLQDFINLNYYFKTMQKVRNYQYYIEKTSQKDLGNTIEIKDELTENTIEVKYKGKIKYINENLIDDNIEYDKTPLLIFDKKKDFYKIELKYYEAITKEFMVNELLKGLNIVHYFNNSSNSHCPKKANLFTSYVIENNSEDLQLDSNEEILNAFYQLRKGYKASYLPPSYELDLRNNEEIYHCFDNILWGISREGFSNIAALTDNENTNRFILSNYINRIDNYFYLYLILLNQYYGLLYLANEISSLPSTVDFYDKNGLKKITQIRNKINFFYLKCIYEEVSHISHQSILYEKMKHILRVDKMMKEFQFELESITSLIKQIHDETEKENQEKEEIRWKLFSIIGISFTLIATTQATLGMFEYFAKSNEAIKGNEIFYSLGTISVFIIICYFIYRIYVNKKKK